MGPKKRGARKRKAETETKIEKPDESGGGVPFEHKTSQGNKNGREGKNKYIGAHVSIAGNMAYSLYSH